MKPASGQISIFTGAVENRRPCDYGFDRYIGQKVQFISGITGTVTEIHDYYTFCETDQGEMVGTPTTISPVER